MMYGRKKNSQYLVTYVFAQKPHSRYITYIDAMFVHKIVMSRL